MMQFHTGGGDNVRGDKIVYYQYFLQDATREIPNYLTTLPSVEWDKIVGRLGEVEQIAQLLDQNEKVVLLNGVGGIGKTTLARIFLRKMLDAYKHVAWLEAASGIKEAFVFNTQLIDSLSLQHQISQIEEKRRIDEGFKLIVNRLRELKGNNLLILDNINEDAERLSTKDCISLNPNWRVLTTSRKELEGFSRYRVEALNLELARELFYLYYKYEQDNSKVDEIIQLVEFHTLSIEIIAKTAEIRIFTLEEVVDILKKKTQIFPLPLHQ